MLCVKGRPTAQTNSEITGIHDLPEGKYVVTRLGLPQR
jgi:hypothetical protein